MKYHHLGIPTDIGQPGEIYLEGYKAFCTDHERNLWLAAAKAISLGYIRTAQ